MEKTTQLIEMGNRYGARNYLPLPVVLTRGEKSSVWDSDGKKYLDFLSSYSALNFGHQHPALMETFRKQAEKLSVCSRAFHAEELSYFLKELAEFSALECVLPMNSGAEAVETALKVARKWAYERKGVKSDRAKIIAMANNFHGRTITIVSFSSEPLYKAGFGPFTPGFEIIPFGEIDALKNAIDENTAAVLLEPIQAEAGILLPPESYLEQVRALCSEKKVLLITDEIQTGLGRTGKDFCVQHDEVVPDLMVLGKSLGGGLLPISAVVGTHEAMDVIEPGQHGSTFGGNPLACAVGRTALKILREEKLSERSAKLGDQIKTFLRNSQFSENVVKEIRGKGMLIGIELTKQQGGARKFCERLAELGVLCKETHQHVIRIAPPLTIENSELEVGLEKIAEVIKKAG